MVYKIKNLKSIILSFAMLALVLAASLLKGNIETNLLKAILPKNAIESTNIIQLANKSASVVKVVFEANSATQLEQIKQNFIDDTEDINHTDISGLINQYVSHPENFLSPTIREQIKAQKYNEIYNNSLETLYNPAGISIIPIDKDPFLLLNSFLTENTKNQQSTYYADDKCYDFITLNISNKDGLSPDVSNKEIAKLVKKQKILTNSKSRIYLAGNPIHSYHTSTKSVILINIICLLSTILIILLTYFYFKNIKILIPISLSIMAGMLSGYVATKLWFESFHLLTMVFSTTLIGIGIDYTYHYCFAQKIDKTFIKDLSFSWLTTIIPFAFIYTSNIELLKQISIFTVFGLSTIYLFVIIFYSEFKFPQPQKSCKFPLKIYNTILILLLFLSALGLTNLHFNDSLSSLYTPSKKLLNAENLFNKISGIPTHNTQVIAVKGLNLEDILEKEEKITAKLTQNNIEYIALSKFIPSKVAQKENFNLTKELYENILNRYDQILSKKQIATLKNMKFTPITFNINDYQYLKNFLLTPNTSMIILNSDNSIALEDENAEIINIKQDIEKYLTKYRQKLFIILTLVVLTLVILLSVLYGFKKGIKILLPSLIGILSATGISSLVLGELNLFSIISLFLVLGFTMDYSIFRAGREENVEDAIFISSLTTAISFLLLSIIGFKLISSISVVLSFGILISYLTGYYMLQLSYEKTKKK